MPKMFENVSLNENDDGTYTIRIMPSQKEKKGKDGEISTSFGKEKTYTAASLEDAMKKIQSFGGDATKTSKEANMEEFMNPQRGKEEVADEDDGEVD